MSLMRQLWLLVLLSTTLAFVGSLYISIWSARDYLSQQLERKNSDNANSLALSMTQQEKDPVMAELQVTALFDTGYYEKIAVVDPLGKVIVERIQGQSDVTVPRWFINMFPIKSTPGAAQINDGWKQYGVVTVVSHNGFAHRALWEQAGTFLFWFTLGGIGVGALGMLLLRTIGRSLGDVVNQATAISERRFISIPEPTPIELRSVTQAMNAMVERVKAMFAEEAERLEALRQKVNRDPVTGLSSRDYFMAHLREFVSGDQFAADGSLVLVRLISLDEINATVGHAQANELLKTLGKVLYNSGNEHPGQRAGRIKGGEFAVICPTIADPAEAARDIHQRLENEWYSHWQNHFPALFHVGAVRYQRGQAVGELLSMADNALAKASSSGANSWVALNEGESRLTVPSDEWRSILTDAVAGSQLHLSLFPVRRPDGTLLHEEGTIRLHLKAGDSALVAGDFMPIAAHLQLSSLIDLNVVALAFAHLARSEAPLAINLAPETIADAGFQSKLRRLLADNAALCPRLSFEVPEHGAFRQFEAFRELALMLAAKRCRVGIEYFGQRFAESDKLATLGLHYLKVHPSYVHDISGNSGNQDFLRGVCQMARRLGIEIIAQGVDHATDIPLLTELGFDAVSGKGVS